MRPTALYAGAGVALAAGLLMGAAMRPSLYPGDRPEGPQVVDAAAGQPTGPFDDGQAFAALGPKIPDYVFGTDAGRAFTWPEQQLAAASPAPRALSEAEAEDASYSRPVSDDPPASTAAASYPSEAGDVVGHARDASATVRERPADIEDEAPPEATGDTSRAAG